MKMYSPTDENIHVALTSGHTLQIPPKSETNPEGVYIEPRFRRKAIQQGAEFVGDENLPPVDPVLTRTQIIKKALSKMLDGNEPTDFKADGKPDLKAVIRRCGFNVSRSDCDKAWAEVKAELSAGEGTGSDEGGEDLE